jgi:FixJ family two-component response regulator
MLESRVGRARRAHRASAGRKRVAAIAMSAMAPRRPLVCVVDDDAALRDSLQWLLTSAGYAVRTYVSGEHFLAEYDPDSTLCVVLDVQLPNASGFDVQQALGARGAVPAVILISGCVSSGVAQDRCLEERAVFLEKPFGDEKLLDLIDRAAARRKERANELWNTA